MSVYLLDYLLVNGYFFWDTLYPKGEFYFRKGFKDICQVLSKSERCDKVSSFDTVQPLVTSVPDPMLNSVPPWSNHYQPWSNQNHYQCEVSTNQG